MSVIARFTPNKCNPANLPSQVHHQLQSTPTPDELRALTDWSCAPAAAKLLNRVKHKQEVNEQIITAQAQDDEIVYQSLSAGQQPFHAF
ncbi:hypothetical protein PAXRUDRAFT_16797 [Paxillus rubicundulus Ve08.2h10]|uniref:Uncharacterized protein n=1 Tax=Paxillus rubicundulus Ve08.2h10 TaxID=930991 RepID=A0A0D0DD35_9AGAM|nr:hypothetical protein PAXRUDRAFT_16797 [Paxillus rubicundulus Ve08.2h10]